MLPVIAFTGARHDRAAITRARTVAARIQRAAAVWAGDATGVDAVALVAAPAHLPRRCFRARSRAPRDLVARSIEMIHALARHPGPRLLLAFPAAPAPPWLAPARRWPSCGSGTWATVALAAGLGIRVIIFTFAPPPAFHARPIRAFGMQAYLTTSIYTGII